MASYAFVANVSSSILSSALPDLVTAFAVFNPSSPPVGIIAFSDLTHLIAVSLSYFRVHRWREQDKLMEIGQQPLPWLRERMVGASVKYLRKTSYTHNLYIGAASLLNLVWRGREL